MSEYRKEDSTLEAIRLAVTIPTITALDPNAIGTVLLLMTPFHYYGKGRDRADTLEFEVPAAGEDTPGWTVEVEETVATVTITLYPEEGELPKGFYEVEPWIHNQQGDVLKTPSGRPEIIEVRASLVRAPMES